MLALGLAWGRYVLLLTAVVTFPLCYLVGSQNGNLDGFSVFFVSETGDRPPESTLFTFGALFGLVLGFLPASLAVYASLFDGNGIARASRRLRTAFGVLVATSALGLVLVASFQFIHAPVPHMIGATMAITSLIVLNVLIVARQMALAPRPLPPSLRVRVVAMALIVATGIVLAVPTAIGDMDEESTARNVAVVAEWVAIYGALFHLVSVRPRDMIFVLGWHSVDGVDPAASDDEGKSHASPPLRPSADASLAASESSSDSSSSSASDSSSSESPSH